MAPLRTEGAKKDEDYEDERERPRRREAPEPRAVAMRA